VTGGTAVAAHAIKLAVLPFANLSGNPDQEYLSDGLTQEMIAQLGRLHPGTLSVIARTSVMRYKNTNTPIDQIGRELGGVDYILEGSAQREANRVRIAAELIKVADQTQLWAESYEKELSGILALQSDVARNVAKALALKLLPAEQARLADVRTVNPEAYDAYLKGSQLWPKMTRADLDVAQKYFELALAKDPNYALAYVGMTWVWIARNQMGIVPPGEALPKSEAAAQRSLELDASLGEAHYALAVVRDQQWDWASAELEWHQAIELCPDLSDARAVYSHYLMRMNRPEEAMAQIQRALELDPINTLVKVFYAVDLLYLRRHDDAIEQLRIALRAEPENPAILNSLWLALAFKGMEKEALATAKSYFKSLYGHPKVEEAFDSGWTRAGYKGGMRQAAEALVAALRGAYVSPSDIATLYLQAGDTDQALTWLEKSFEVRDPTMGYLGLPEFDPVRSEPRFQSLLRRVGLPQ
jgi:TolB-like protein